MRSTGPRIFAFALVGIALSMLLLLALGNGGPAPDGQVGEASESTRLPSPTNATGATVAPSAAPVQAAARDVEWHELPLHDDETALADAWHIGSLTAIGKRLFINGDRGDGGARIWYSDDGAHTWLHSWREAEMLPSPSWGNEPHTGAITEIAGTLERMVALGWRQPAGGSRDQRRPAAWLSSDGGEHWSGLPADSGPEAEALLWTGSAFLAIAVEPFAVWRSSDGVAWRQGAAPPGAKRAYAELATHAGRVAALLRGVDGSAYEVWITDDGEQWRQPQRDGRPIQGLALQSGPSGFVAMQRDRSASGLVSILRSADGESWERQSVQLETPQAWQEDCCYWWLADGDDGLVLNAVGAPAPYDPAYYAWFLPRDARRASWIGGFGDTIWQGEAFFAHRPVCASGELLTLFHDRTDRPSRADENVCIGSVDRLVAGLPIHSDPSVITGTWSHAFPSCSYLQEEGGHLWRLHWPPGYRIDQAGALRAADGTILSRSGSTITLRGGRTSDESHCAGGGDYAVTAVDAVQP